MSGLVTGGRRRATTAWVVGIAAALTFALGEAVPAHASNLNMASCRGCGYWMVYWANAGERITPVVDLSDGGHVGQVTDPATTVTGQTSAPPPGYYPQTSQCFALPGSDTGRCVPPDPQRPVNETLYYVQNLVNPCTYACTPADPVQALIGPLVQADVWFSAAGGSYSVADGSLPFFQQILAWNGGKVDVNFAPALCNAGGETSVFDSGLDSLVTGTIRTHGGSVLVDTGGGDVEVHLGGGCSPGASVDTGQGSSSVIYADNGVADYIHCAEDGNNNTVYADPSDRVVGCAHVIVTP